MSGPIKIGSVTIDTIGQLKVGSSNVTAAYVGSVLVFPASTTTTTSTTSTTSTTTSTTTAPPTTTTTTTLAPATINWYNYELPSPYVDSDLEINGTLYAGGTAQGSFNVAGNSSVLAKQLSATSSGILGGYNLIIKNITDSTVVYDNTVTAVVSTYSIINSNTFTAAAGKIYAISASTFDATIPTTTTTTTTTTSTTTTTTTETPTTSTTTTTTTTTAPVGTWKIANSSDDLDISGISIGGSSGVVTIGSFPSTPSTNIEGTTQLISIPGTYTVTLVLVTSGTTGQTIKITDSNGTVQTQTIPNPNSGDITFTNVYFNASVQVLIECLSAPIPTTTTTTTSTTTTTTTEAPTTTTTSTTTTTTTSAPSSVTIFWNTSEVGSGGVRLVIYDSTSTPIVDEESSGAGPTNGSVTTSNTPFTVAVSRIAGTEVAQYRICNDSTSTEITHNYSVTSEVTYVVDPTPLTTTIFATYGDSNTPSNCSVE